MGDVVAEYEFVWHRRDGERLFVGVAYHEVDIGYVLPVHIVDGIATPSSYSDDFDYGIVVEVVESGSVGYIVVELVVVHILMK